MPVKNIKSWLSPDNIEYILSLYEEFKRNPEAVDPSWRYFFEGFEFALEVNYTLPSFNGISSTIDKEKAILQLEKEFCVFRLIDAYRVRGHLYANINPLSPRIHKEPPINPEDFGLEKNDLDRVFQAATEIGLKPSPLRKILEVLISTYCGTIGIEYRYIRIPKILKWIQERVEKTQGKPYFTPKQKLHFYRKLVQATAFEQFLHRRFVGQKRFSLEGAEALIPALDDVIYFGARLGIREFVIGMAHRGRLNVLTNIMGKSYERVFAEFEGKGISGSEFEGDVKYHLGYSNDIEIGGNKIHLSLLPNPSHLESVNPVAIGAARGKIDHFYDEDIDKLAPILIHGDASLAGQGVVYEVIQMSRLQGYKVGGTIHIVINNQIGFTTPPVQGRSSTYCTDVAKVTLSPVFHVNGDDPEALAYAAELAMEFRQKFNRDVFIDVVCYRKYGHNEGDEPRYTQPLLYAKIAQHPSPVEVYKQKLINENIISEKEAKAIWKQVSEELDRQYNQAQQQEYDIKIKLSRQWESYKLYTDEEQDPKIQVGVPLETLKLITDAVTSLPKDFHLHPNLKRLLEMRRKMIYETKEVDWGMAEHLAYGSLLLEGYTVRLSGQDVERGTFSHRHAVLFDQKNEDKYIPLQHISLNQGKFYIYNSLLSEYAVLGFEFGYAYAIPNALVIWEAQFGDFANGAQVIIDQYIAATKTKWQRMNGLVMYLPHGYEGQGPEHSSARIERFLELCAQNNMFVCNLTTPANLFAVLRRQMKLPYRKPLIIFTPKSLLRHPECVSALEDFTEGTFHTVYDDREIMDKKEGVTRLVFCCGKLYYDLILERRAQGKYDTGLIRIEQLYPLDTQKIIQIANSYPNVEKFIWAQEEPENMGAWSFILRKFPIKPLELVSRKESPTPATGSYRQHLSQQAYIIKKALDLPPETELKTLKR